jgi:ABC-2 type transport system permease protein
VRGAIRSELLKLRTIRMPYGLVLGVVALAAIAAAAIVAAADAVDAADPAVLAGGATAGTFLVVVLGVIIVAGEYRRGTIAETFLTTPRREKVVGSKIVAGAVAGLVAGAAAAAVVLAIAIPWLEARANPLPLGADLAESFLRLLGAYVLWTLIGVGVGAITRRQILGIVGALGWFLIGEPLVAVLGAVLSDAGGDSGPLARYLPGAVLDALVSGEGIFGGDEVLAPLPAFGLALAYVTGLLAIGGALVVWRDPPSE